MNLNKITYTETLAIDTQTTQPIRAYAEQANTIEVLAPVSGFNTAYAVVQGLKGNVVNPKLRTTERLYMSPLSDEGEYKRWNFVLPGAVLNDMSLMNSTGVRVKVEFWYIQGDFLGVEKYNTETGIADLLATDYPSATDDQFVRVIDTESDWYYDGDLETWVDYEAYKQVGINNKPTEVADFTLEKGVYTGAPSHAPTNTEYIIEELKKMLRVDGSRAMSGDLNMDGNDIDNVTALTLYSTDGTAVATYDGRHIVWAYDGVNAEMFLNLYVEVKADGAIANGDSLMFTGQVGASGRLYVAKATRAELNANPNKYAGQATYDMTDGENGQINWYGTVNGLNTSGLTQGTPIYVDTREGATAGAWTTVRPEAPNAQILIGAVGVVSSTQGSIKVRPEIGRALGDLHNVYLNGHTIETGDLLVGDAVNNRWTYMSKADYLEAVTTDITTLQGEVTTLQTDKEDKSNKVTAFDTPTDTEYPSAKLVKDNLDLKEDKANKGATNGYAPLVSGLIPSAYIPNSYDNYEEVATYADLPTEGRESTVYVVLEDETSGGNTSTYRWTGTVYGKISDTLSASEVKTLYESNADTNAYTDAEKTKLSDLYTKAQLDTLFGDRYTKAEVDALLDSLKAIYGWESTVIATYDNGDTFAKSVIADYDFILASWVESDTTPNEVYTVYFKPSELVDGNCVRTQIQNNPVRVGCLNNSSDTITVGVVDNSNTAVPTATAEVRLVGVKFEQQLAENISYDNTDSDLVATDVKGALDELDSDVDTLETDLATETDERKTKDAELEVKIAQVEETARKIAESDDVGTVEGNTVITLPKNVASGDMNVEVEGLTLEQLVDGADIADGNSVSFDSVSGVDYYDTLNSVIIAGDGTTKTATNSSGETADMMIIPVPPQLEGTTDADTIANIEEALNGQVLTKGLHSASGSVRLKAKGKNLFDGELEIGYIATTTGDNTSTTLHARTINYIKVANNNDYTITKYNDDLTVLTGRVDWYEYDINMNFIISKTNVSKITTETNTSYIRFSIINDPNINRIIQLEQGDTSTDYEAYKDTTLYLKDDVRRSVGSVADTIERSNGKYYKVKRINTADVTGVVSVDTTNYTDALDGGLFINELDAGGTETGTIGTDSTSGDGTLYYQLATPTTTELDADGQLIGDSKGQVTIDNAIPDVDIYDTNINITDTDNPISELVKVVKLGDAQVELDIADATIAGDGLSFTHTGLTSGDAVFFVYKPSATIYGMTTVSYYNSELVRFSPDGTAYKLDWSVDNSGNITWSTVEVE